MASNSNNGNNITIPSNPTNSTWSQVINLVESANLPQSQHIKWQQKNRKKAYKNQLDQQLQYINHKYVLEKGEKQKQRLEIEERVKQEDIQFREKKIKKIKTQQKYRAENLELLGSVDGGETGLAGLIKNKSKLHSNNHSFDSNEKYKEHPFISLVDQQDQRMKQTRNNFQLQNKLNAIQIAIHQQRKKEQNISNKKIRQQFETFVQNQFKKHQQQRQKFKNKYLTIKKWEQSQNTINNNSDKNSRQNSPSPEPHLSSIPTLNTQPLQSNSSPVTNSNSVHPSSLSLQKKYLNFLDHQVQQHKFRKLKQKQLLDNRSSEINRHIDVPDSSPAFLGRLAASNDRKKQLEILDNNLYHFNAYGKRKRKDSKNGSKYRNLYNVNVNTNNNKNFDTININSKINNRYDGSISILNKSRQNLQMHRSVQISPRLQYNGRASIIGIQQSSQSPYPQQRPRAQSNMKLLPSISVAGNRQYQNGNDRSSKNLQTQFTHYKNKLQARLPNNLYKERQAYNNNKVFYKDQVLFQNKGDKSGDGDKSEANGNFNTNSVKVINMTNINDQYIPITLTNPKNIPTLPIATTNSPNPSRTNIIANPIYSQKKQQRQKKAYQKYDFITGSNKIMYV